MYERNYNLRYPWMSQHASNSEIYENSRIIEGHLTSELFPAVWYFKTKNDEYENFRWAGEIVLKNYQKKEIRYWSVGKEKIDVLKSLHFSLRLFQEAESLRQNLNKYGKVHQQIDHLFFDMTSLGSQFWRSIKNATESFHVYPNVKCRFCGHALNHLFDSVFPEYADHVDSFHCYGCWEREIPAEIEARCPTKKPPSPSEIMRRKAYTEGDRGIHWTTVGPREDWICYLCGGEVEKVGGIGKFPQGAQIEHIIPISKGGSHTWDNVKLSHRSCNIKKSNKIDEGQQP